MGRGNAKPRQQGCALELKVITYLRLKVNSARGTLDAQRGRCRGCGRNEVIGDVVVWRCRGSGGSLTRFDNKATVLPQR
jgi:hypothetical protein